MQWRIVTEIEKDSYGYIRLSSLNNGFLPVDQLGVAARSRRMLRKQRDSVKTGNGLVILGSGRSSKSRAVYFV